MLNGQCDFIESIKRASSHIRFFWYRRSIKKPIGIGVTLKNFLKRFIYEYAGIE